jgi:hypothetical protein
MTKPVSHAEKHRHQFLAPRSLFSLSKYSHCSHSNSHYFLQRIAPTRTRHSHYSLSDYSRANSDYSRLRATTGSSPDALLDGIQIASAATPISTIGTSANVITSNPPLPYS